jgi:transposase
VTNYDPIKQLQDAGIPVDKLSEDQRKQLQSLSPEEAATLGKIQERIAGEVQGFRAADDTGWVIF